MEQIYVIADTQRVNFQDVKVTQNDSNVQFIIKVQQGGKDISLPIDTVYTLSSLRDDRVEVLSPNLGVVTGRNEITFDLGTKELALTGVVRASVQMISADGRVSTLSFNYSVAPDLSNAQPSEEDKSLIEVVLQQGPTAIDAAKGATQETLNAAEIAKNAKGPQGVRGPEGPQGLAGNDGTGGPGAIMSVNGKVGVIEGLAEQSSVDKHTTQ